MQGNGPRAREEGGRKGPRVSTRGCGKVAKPGLRPRGRRNPDTGMSWERDRPGAVHGSAVACGAGAGWEGGFRPGPRVSQLSWEWPEQWRPLSWWSVMQNHRLLPLSKRPMVSDAC